MKIYYKKPIKKHFHIPWELHMKLFHEYHKKKREESFPFFKYVYNRLYEGNAGMPADEMAEHQRRKRNAKKLKRWTTQGQKVHYKKMLIARDGALCNDCKKENIPLTIDHIVPVGDGGSREMENLQLLCVPCHVKKDKQYGQDAALQDRMDLFAGEKHIV